MMLEGKAAVVTGAGGRIGKAIALQFAREGASVVVNDYGVDPDGTSPDSAHANAVVDEIRAFGGVGVASPESVAEPQSSERIIQTCVDAFGSIDILVNAAGILVNSLVLDTPDEVWDRLMAVHARGTFLCAKYAGLRMRDRRSGRIINFTSQAGLESYPGVSGYAMAKAAVNNFTWMFAQEMAFHGVTVNAVGPTVVMPRRLSQTGRSEPLMPDSVMNVRAAYGLDTKSQGPVAFRPEPVAALVTYLASDQAGYVNGQVIGVSGGALRLWGRPQVTSSAFTQGDWTVESIAERFQGSIGKGLSNPMPTMPL